MAIEIFPTMRGVVGTFPIGDPIKFNSLSTAVIYYNTDTKESWGDDGRPIEISEENKGVPLAGVQSILLPAGTVSTVIHG